MPPGKAGNDGTTSSSLQQILWPDKPHQHSAAGRQLHQRWGCLFFFCDSIGPFVLLSAHSSQSFISSCFFPVCSYCCSNCYLPYFLYVQPTHGTYSASCCPLSRVFSGYPERPVNLWRTSPFPKGFWHNSSLQKWLTCVVIFLGHRVFLGFLH